MNPRMLKALSNFMILIVMVISSVYFYRTWLQDEPRWYFFILAIAIALLFSYNLLVKKRN